MTAGTLFWTDSNLRVRWCALVKRSIAWLLTTTVLLASVMFGISTPRYAQAGTALTFRPGIVAVGSNHALALRDDGTVWAWGDNDYGQLGDGTQTQRTTPVQLAGLTNVTAIATRTDHSLALVEGEVWAWGENEYGQLGASADLSFSVKPRQVPGLTNVKAIEAGRYHSLALKADGTVWAWGRNTRGQLGTPGSDSVAPVKVAGLADVVALAAGHDHNLALKADGTVWAWGAGDFAQLGTGDDEDSDRPVQVPKLTNVVAVAAGQYHSVALKSDGTVWVWGFNRYHELGVVGLEEALTPTQVEGLTDIIAVVSGHSHNLALKRDGTVMAWGRNDFFQLGDGTGDRSAVPLEVGRSGSMVALAAGGYSSAAVDTEGYVWTWGANDVGQLGTGTRRFEPSPTKVDLDLFTGAVAQVDQKASNDPTSDNTGHFSAINLKATAAGLSVLLRWDATPGKDLVGYYLFRATSSGAQTEPLFDFPIQGTSYLDTGVAADRTYYYQVAPVYANGRTGDPSDEVKVTITGTLQASTSGILLQLGNPEAFVRGKAYLLDPEHQASPVILNGRMVTPIDGLVKALGGSVTYSSDGKQVTLAANGHRVEVGADSGTLLADGKEIPMDSTPLIIAGTFYVPARYVLSALGYDLAWSPSDGTVWLSPQAAAPSPAPTPTPQPPGQAPARKALSDIYWVEGGTKLVLDGEVLFEDNEGIYDPRRSPDKRYLVYSRGEDQVIMRDLRTGETSVLYELPPEESISYQVFPAGWSADGKEVALLVSYRSGFVGGNALRIVDLKGKLLTTVTKGFRYATWGTGGQFVVSRPGQEVDLLSRDGQTLKSLTVPPYYQSLYDMADVAISPDGKIVTYHVGETYYRHDVTTDTFEKLFDLQSESLAGQAPVMSDGRILVADKGGIYVYDPETKKLELHAKATLPSFPNFE